jgi:hypothetical protein
LAFASPEEAIAWARRRSPDTFPIEDDVQAVPLALPVAPPATEADPNGNYVIRRKDEDGRPYGPILFRFRAQAINDAAQIALQWSRDNNLQNQVRLSHVGDVPVELLNPHERNHAQRELDDASSRAETPVTRGEWGGGSPVVSEPQNFPQASAQDSRATDSAQSGENFTGRWEIRNRDTGEVLHTLTGIGNSTNVARHGANRWAERTGYDDEFVVRPVFA